jgi:hypothetical protein
MAAPKSPRSMIRPLLLLAVLVGASLTLRQAAAERNRPQLPPQTAVDEIVRDVDARFESLWKAANLEPAAAADDMLVARRISLALVGSILSMQDLRWLEAQPKEERVLLWTDKLLADPRCHDYLAERLARAMNSLAPAEPFFMYRRRRFVEWLSEQIANRVPYDEIVRRCIAAEGVWTENPAANFLTGNDIDPNKLANRTARGFLGLRIDCAECHDHPFAAWKQSDFRSLAAWYGNAELSWRGVVDRPGPAKVDHPLTKVKEDVEPKAPYQPELLPADGSPRKRLAAWATHPKNRFFAKAIVNRMWHLLYGKGLVNPVDNLDGESAAPEVLEALGTDFAEHGFDLHRLVRTMVSLKAFRLQSVFDVDASDAAERVFATFPISRLRPEQAAGSLVQVSRLFSIDDRTSTLLQLTAFGSQNDFIERYGDAGEEETTPHDGNVAQRLLMLNGEVVHKEIKSDLATSAKHLATLVPDDVAAVAFAFQLTLSRQPTGKETKDFCSLLQSAKDREAGIEDALWALVNCTEFSWNR